MTSTKKSAPDSRLCNLLLLESEGEVGIRDSWFGAIRSVMVPLAEMENVGKGLICGEGL